VHVAYSDMLDDFTEEKLALLNEFYTAHFQISSCADLAYDTLSFFRSKYSKY
jgi:mannitol-1-phosphate/altronate dehydrogenase